MRNLNNINLPPIINIDPPNTGRISRNFNRNQNQNRRNSEDSPDEQDSVITGEGLFPNNTQGDRREYPFDNERTQERPTQNNTNDLIGDVNPNNMTNRINQTNQGNYPFFAIHPFFRPPRILDFSSPSRNPNNFGVPTRNLPREIFINPFRLRKGLTLS